MNALYKMPSLGPREVADYEFSQVLPNTLSDVFLCKYDCMHAGTSPASYASNSSIPGCSVDTSVSSHLHGSGSFPAPQQPQPSVQSNVPALTKEERMAGQATIAAASSGPCTWEEKYKEECGLHSACTLTAVRAALMEILDEMPAWVCSVASAHLYLLPLRRKEEEDERKRRKRTVSSSPSASLSPAASFMHAIGTCTCTLRLGFH
jgi:hypothetical protein